MGGSVEDYEEVLQVYLEEGCEVLEDIQKKYESEDWKSYVIYVHSLKSNSFGIGADELGELAKSLELAGKEGNISYIQVHHGEMVKLYQEVLLEISGGNSIERGEHL
jgi:HPt (histidine-containing phosphotransfer) domain-containing protein